MKTYKLGYRRRNWCVMCCCEDGTWCHPSARDGEEPRHVVWCSRCAMNIDRRTLCQQLQSTIIISDVTPVDVHPVCRTLIFCEIWCSWDSVSQDGEMPCTNPYWRSTRSGRCTSTMSKHMSCTEALHTPELIRECSGTAA